MIRTLIWHLAGFAAFGLISWGALTLALMVPAPAGHWAAWAYAGAILIKIACTFAALVSGYLAFAWLIDPMELS